MEVHTVKEVDRGQGTKTSWSQEKDLELRRKVKWRERKKELEDDYNTEHKYYKYV